MIELGRWEVFLKVEFVISSRSLLHISGSVELYLYMTREADLVSRATAGVENG